MRTVFETDLRKSRGAAKELIDSEIAESDFFHTRTCFLGFFFRNAKIVDKQGDPLSNYTTRDKNDQKFLLEKKEKSEIFEFRERKKTLRREILNFRGISSRQNKLNWGSFCILTAAKNGARIA